MALNVLGNPLKSCSHDPKTGFYRDGCCNTDAQDRGVHTVCVRVSNEFLEYSRSRGNDLITPAPQFQFPGLKEGDQWCLCAARFAEAMKAGVAPRVVLEATHEKTLEYVTMEDLMRHAILEAN